MTLILPTVYKLLAWPSMFAFTKMRKSDLFHQVVVVNEIYNYYMPRHIILHCTLLDPDYIYSFTYSHVEKGMHFVHIICDQ